jgi:hypothetical protein
MVVVQSSTTGCASSRASEEAQDRIAKGISASKSRADQSSPKRGWSNIALAKADPQCPIRIPRRQGTSHCRQTMGLGVGGKESDDVGVLIRRRHQPHSDIHIHFSFTLLRLCLRVFVGFYRVWRFLKLHKSCGNRDVFCEERVQFLQATLASHTSSVVVQGGMFRHTDSPS